MLKSPISSWSLDSCKSSKSTMAKKYIENVAIVGVCETIWYIFNFLTHLTIPTIYNTDWEIRIITEVTNSLIGQWKCRQIYYRRAAQNRKAHRHGYHPLREHQRASLWCPSKESRLQRPIHRHCSTPRPRCTHNHLERVCSPGHTNQAHRRCCCRQRSLGYAEWMGQRWCQTCEGCFPRRLH